MKDFSLIRWKEYYPETMFPDLPIEAFPEIRKFHKAKTGKNLVLLYVFGRYTVFVEA